MCLFISSSLIFNGFICLITSVSSLIREIPSKCIIRTISVKTRGKCRSIIRRLLRNTRSATSEYLSTPPNRSIIIIRSATSLGDSGKALILFTVGVANLTPLCSSFRFAARPPSSNGFITPNRERTLKPLNGASGCQNAMEKSVRSSVFASKSKMAASSKNSSTPSGEVTSSSEEDFTARNIKSATIPKSSRGMNLVPLSASIRIASSSI